MPRGGRRPGAGRKPGSTSAKPNRIHPTARAKELAREALLAATTPLSAILEAMNRHLAAARAEQDVSKALQLYAAAAEIARKAAPFVHPQLSSVEHKVNAEFEAAVLSLDEAARQAADPEDEEERPDKVH